MTTMTRILLTTALSMLATSIALSIITAPAVAPTHRLAVAAAFLAAAYGFVKETITP